MTNERIGSQSPDVLEAENIPLSKEQFVQSLGEILSSLRMLAQVPEQDFLQAQYIASVSELSRRLDAILTRSNSVALRSGLRSDSVAFFDLWAKLREKFHLINIDLEQNAAAGLGSAEHATVKLPHSGKEFINDIISLVEATSSLQSFLNAAK